MPIMERPNSRARSLHKQILNHAQEFGADVESFELEEKSARETPNLLKNQRSPDKEGSGSLAGFPIGR